MAIIRRPRSDIGTVVVHWLLVATLLGAILTGLSIAAVDNPNFSVLHYVGFILLRENVWLLHLYFSVVLLSSVVAYVIYIKSAGLTDRIRLDAVRLRAIFIGGRPMWASTNVLLYWFFFIALTLEIVAGILVFFGWGGFLLSLHLHCVWLLLLFPFAHVLVHWLYGGSDQLFRIFRAQWRLPQQAPELVDVLIERVQALEFGSAERLKAGEKAPPRRARIVVPLVLAAAAGAAMAPLSISVEREARQTLRLVRISSDEAPVMNGDISDPAWRRAPAMHVLTQHGANFDAGASAIEIRALHDGVFTYFAFTWTDPTRSLKHMPLVKREDGWRLMRSAKPGNEVELHEDKFAVLLAAGGQRLLGKGFHFGRRPLPDKPESATGRGLHYIAGGVGDIWQWRASHGGLQGWIDSGHFSSPLATSESRQAGRYTGGFALDPNPTPYQANFDIIGDREAYPLVRPRRMPKSPNLRLASYDLDCETSDAENWRAWIAPEDTEPFSEELDRATPIGTAIPSILISEKPAERPTDVLGAARWNGGRWSLEVKRRLDTGSPVDVAIRSGTLMWVAAFDHAETWHTYHVRPIELETE